MPRIVNVVEKEIHMSEANRPYFILGTIHGFNLDKWQADVKVVGVEGDTRVYANLQWPINGSGIKGSPPMVGDSVIIGFLNNSSALPFVVSCFPGNLVVESTREDISPVNRAPSLMVRNKFK
jgi:hypothetical protein